MAPRPTSSLSYFPFLFQHHVTSAVCASLNSRNNDHLSPCNEKPSRPGMSPQRCYTTRSIRLLSTDTVYLSLSLSAGHPCLAPQPSARRAAPQRGAVSFGTGGDSRHGHVGSASTELLQDMRAQLVTSSWVTSSQRLTGNGETQKRAGREP